MTLIPKQEAEKAAKEKAIELILLHKGLGGDLKNWALTFTDQVLRNPEIGDQKRKFWKNVQAEIKCLSDLNELLKTEE